MELKRLVITKKKEDGSQEAIQYLLNEEQYDRVMKALEGVEGFEIPATADMFSSSSNAMLDLMGKSLQRPIIYDRSEKPDDMDLNTVIGYQRAFGFVIADSKGKDKLNTHVG